MQQPATFSFFQHEMHCALCAFGGAPQDKSVTHGDQGGIRIQSLGDKHHVLGLPILRAQPRIVIKMPNLTARIGGLVLKQSAELWRHERQNRL